ncbi:MAG: LysM peptidoglycan-binding domain-containing protein [Phycisphaerales bacterium JB040]
MSLPSQRRRGAASGRASSKSYRRRRTRGRRQGVPVPLKAGLAVSILAIVLWTGWYLLLEGEPGDGGKQAPALTQLSSERVSDESEDIRPEDLIGGRSLSATEGVPAEQETASRPVERSGMLSDALRARESETTLADAPVVIDSNPERQRERAARSEPTPPRETSRPAVQPVETSDAGDAAGLSGAARAMRDADILVTQGKPVRARGVLNGALLSSRTTDSERVELRARLQALNATLVFGPVADPDDPLTESYRVQSGDTLARIASRRQLATHYKLIARVNGIADPSKIRVGQSLKLVRGPFHAVVDKSDYRMDIYHGPPDSPTSWVYLRSFDIGLGEADGTPIGHFVVSSNKLENPGWVNPRDSSERYDRNDPANPIGEYWLGLDGVGPSSVHTGFGIHGTIEPESIGQSMSMGCVRLRDADIALVFELLEEQISVVHIVP